MVDEIITFNIPGRMVRINILSSQFHIHHVIFTIYIIYGWISFFQTDCNKIKSLAVAFILSETACPDFQAGCFFPQIEILYLCFLSSWIFLIFVIPLKHRDEQEISFSE